MFQLTVHTWSVPVSCLFFLFPSDGVNATVDYVLEVHSVSPLFGSLMGGTRLTVSGSGFSSDTSDNQVSVGEQRWFEQFTMRESSPDRQRSSV